MKGLLVFAAFLAVAAAQYNYQPPRDSYGPPRQQERQAPVPAAPRDAYGPPQQQEHVPQTYRHVYVHVAPDEPVSAESKVIRVPGGGDKHVNIIFVKAPSQSSSQQTEVILPEPDQHKNLVYVLLKKGDNTADIRVRGPPKAQPAKPEVYFIRYQDQKQAAPQQPVYGPPQSQPAPQQPNNQYGTPF